jgi:uncharacterized protein YyaL (SSP411 family)
MPNRLAAESSPYLLQHKDNPVDWYPWGPEAFEIAKRQDKPVFVSIGYAACHWCHVMEHESFENTAIAGLMNELFVNIKVDREERPDVDSIYMNAIQIMGQGGGWPLSAFCTPDGKPYYLGTYFPPEDRYGRPGFPAMLRAMSQAYREQRDKVVQNTDAILEGLRHVDEHFRKGAARGSVSALDAGTLITAARQLAQRSDPVHGGLGSKPKFPSSSSHDLLGRAGRLEFGKPAREAFLLQARQMARGGIYDHLGGGFSRYSVDERWLVPHFEKMLYDNAQLLGIYGDVHALAPDTEDARLARQVIGETIDWLTREMQHPSGALYASQDADSEGEEGKFYVWTPDQIRAVLGPVDAIFFGKAYGVTAAGNFEHGTTVLSRVTERGPDSDERALADMRARLFAARSQRVPPATDTKVLSGWNGMAVAGAIRAWEATGDARALDLARAVAEFLAREMLHEQGTRLWRVFKDGHKKLEGTLEDYAQVTHAFLRMAEATGDDTWWQRGARLADVMIERFYEEPGGVGVFYMTPADAGELLVHRPESHSDGAMPSGSSVAVDCLVRLGLVSGDARALDIAERYLAGRAAQASENPFAFSRLLAALDLYLHGIELVVSPGHGRDELLTAARRAYAPSLMIAGPWAALSLLEGRGPAADGSARAFVCRGQTCSAPVSDPRELVALLGERAGQPA